MYVYVQVDLLEDLFIESFLIAMREILGFLTSIEMFNNKSADTFSFRIQISGEMVKI